LGVHGFYAIFSTSSLRHLTSSAGQPTSLTPTFPSLPKTFLPFSSFDFIQETMSQSVHAVTDASFDADVLKSDLPVLVDFWAEWCGPCKMIGPIVEEIAGEYQGKLKVAKLNVDENAAIPAKHGIRGIPTLMLFKNGAVVAQKVGASAKSQLTAWIDSNL